MGRYYSGDIEGKFWFGVQDSNDASFFGGEEIEPNYLQYLFTKEHDLEKVKAGIAKCEKALSKWKKLMDNESGGYNDEMLTWSARLKLGEKILACLEKKGTCEFEAEL